jgi:hypothetical protein
MEKNFKQGFITGALLAAAAASHRLCPEPAGPGNGQAAKG